MLNVEIKKQILEFLKQNSPRDFNIQEIADSINVHRNTVSTYLKVLAAEKLIKITRKIGKANLYAIKLD